MRTQRLLITALVAAYYLAPVMLVGVPGPALAPAAPPAPTAQWIDAKEALSGRSIPATEAAAPTDETSSPDDSTARSEPSAAEKPVVVAPMNSALNASAPDVAPPPATATAVAHKLAHTAERAPRRRTTKCEAGATQGIAALAPDRFQVDSDLVDYYAHHLREASDLAYVSWHRDDAGKIDGFRVGRMRCDSALRSAGFEPGDVVLSINGDAVRTIPGALVAMNKLRHKHALRVLVRRDGQERELRYRIG